MILALSPLHRLDLHHPPLPPLTSSAPSLRNTPSISARVADSWSNNAVVGSAAPIGCATPSLAKAFDVSAATSSSFTEPVVDLDPVDDAVENAVDSKTNGSVKYSSSSSFATPFRPPFLSSDGSIAIHAGFKGERLGRGIATDAITTPVVNTSAYFFKKTADLIDFKMSNVCVILVTEEKSVNLRESSEGAESNDSRV